jgi:hypothetical protein
LRKIDINEIRNNLDKVKTLKDKINNMKIYDDIIVSSIFLVSIMPVIYLMVDIGIANNNSGMHFVFQFFMAIFMLFVGLLGTCLISMMFFKITSFFSRIINKKELKELSKFNSKLYNKDNIFKKTDLMDLLKTNSELSDQIKVLKESYFSGETISVEDLLYCVILDNFKKETNYNFELYNEYIEMANKELDKSYHDKFIINTLDRIVNKMTEKDFFLNKNKLIDLVLENIDSMLEKKTILQIIKSKLKTYNSEKEKEKTLNESFLKLKKETSNKEGIKHIEKEKTLIIKNI